MRSQETTDFRYPLPSWAHAHAEVMRITGILVDSMEAETSERLAHQCIGSSEEIPDEFSQYLAVLTVWRSCVLMLNEIADLDEFLKHRRPYDADILKQFEISGRLLFDRNAPIVIDISEQAYAVIHSAFENRYYINTSELTTWFFQKLLSMSPDLIRALSEPVITLA